MIQEPVTAEAMAALNAVEFVRDLGLQEIILEGGSMIVVKALGADRGSKRESVWADY